MKILTATVVALVAASLAAPFTARAADPPPYVAADRPAKVAAIPGVVANSAQWEVVFSSVTGQDGIVGAADGGVLVAMQDDDVVRKVAPNGTSAVYLVATHGAGALGMDNDGRVFAVRRKASVGLFQIAPTLRSIAEVMPDGKPIAKPADLVVDLKGGFYLTGDAFQYVDPKGVVTTLDPDIKSNGVILSPDGKTLYVTDETRVIAFEVPASGVPTNRRMFADLRDLNADGMAVDAAGRVYVCGRAGVHVISPQGRELGVIPTARRPTSLAFAGPGKRTLYMVMVGASAPNGAMLTLPGGAQGRTLYRLPMLAEGYKGRPK